MGTYPDQNYTLDIRLRLLNSDIYIKNPVPIYIFLIFLFYFFPYFNLWVEVYSVP